jgi:tetratricopeptide (TPR) repeat protein
MLGLLLSGAHAQAPAREASAPANLDLDAILRNADASASKGQWDEAIAGYTQALRIQPNFDRVLAARGVAWANKGNLDSALADCNAALSLNPELVDAIINRGVLYLCKDDTEDAIRDALAGLRLKPNHAGIHNLLGDIALHKAGYRGAIKVYSDAIRLEAPDQTRNLSVYYADRANAYNLLGNLDAALRDCHVATQFDAANSHAWYTEGQVLNKKGDFAGAIAAHTSGITCAPTSPENYNALAWLKATCVDARFRDGKAALQNALRACELTDYKHGDMLDTLAAAYAETGDFDTALTWEYGAIGLTTNDKDKADLQKHAKLYESHRPYRDLGGTGD